MTAKLKKTLLLSITLTALFALYASSIGSVNYELSMLVSGQLSEVDQRIFFDIRLPRIVFAILVGGALGLAGVGTQGLFQNPLADPYVLGISGGASVGAVCALTFLKAHSSSTIGIFAFVGAAVVGVVLMTLTRRFNWSHHAVLLVGIGMNLFCGALLSIIMFFHHQEASQIVLWLMGNLNQAGWTENVISLIVTVLGGSFLFSQAHNLDLHLLGEEAALSLGADTERYRSKAILGISLLVSAAVSFCGAIGFVGLVIPHAVRLFLGPKHLPLLCIAPIVGAGFLLVCDTIARTMLLPQEIPVGIISGLFGGPIFVYLLAREVGRE